jgi:thiamine biosynthesis lipoprotein
VSAEAHRSFACFGGTVTVHVRGTSTARSEEAADRAQEKLLDANRRLSRFREQSELSRLNRDPREEVPASSLMRGLASAVTVAGLASGGLVDATLLDAIEQAGYRHSLEGHLPVVPVDALPCRVEHKPGKPHPSARWRLVGVDEEAATIVRPPGLRIDSGGIAKGLLADLLAVGLGEQAAFAIDCCGDIRIGGRGRRPRRVLVDEPFGGAPIHELRLWDGAVATSGIGRRCWVGPDGRAAHHILDPSTGEPAFTGIVQATALAPSALLAEAYAKAALLSGPERAAEWLPHGGIVVRDDGRVDLFEGDRPLAELARAA